MLRPKRDQVVHRRSVIPFNVCAEELSTLREPNRVETVLEFCDVRKLFSDKVDLIVHVSILRNLGEFISRVRGTVSVYTYETSPAILVLVPVDVHRMDEDSGVHFCD